MSRPSPAKVTRPHRAQPNFPTRARSGLTTGTGNCWCIRCSRATASSLGAEARAMSFSRPETIAAATGALVRTGRSILPKADLFPTTPDCNICGRFSMAKISPSFGNPIARTWFPGRGGLRFRLRRPLKKTFFCTCSRSATAAQRDINASSCWKVSTSPEPWWKAGLRCSSVRRAP